MLIYKIDRQVHSTDWCNRQQYRLLPEQERCWKGKISDRWFSLQWYSIPPHAATPPPGSLISNRMRNGGPSQ